MSVAPIRPRFELRPQMGFDDCVRALDSAFAQDEVHDFRVVDRHVDVTVTRAHRKLWTPCVQLEFDEDEETGATVVHALIGPHPDVWTLYAVVTLHMILLVVFALPFGLVQITLLHNPWALWIALAGVVGVACIYALSQVGRRISRDETRALDAMVRESLLPNSV